MAQLIVKWNTMIIAWPKIFVNSFASGLSLPVFSLEIKVYYLCRTGIPAQDLETKRKKVDY